MARSRFSADGGGAMFAHLAAVLAAFGTTEFTVPFRFIPCLLGTAGGGSAKSPSKMKTPVTERLEEVSPTIHLSHI
eukprot:3920138-Karenia_brevis.AAC.1